MRIYLVRFSINNIAQFCAHSTQEQAENHLNALTQNKDVNVNPVLQMADINSTIELVELINELNRLNN